MMFVMRMNINSMTNINRMTSPKMRYPPTFLCVPSNVPQAHELRIKCLLMACTSSASTAYTYTPFEDARHSIPRACNTEVVTLPTRSSYPVCDAAKDTSSPPWWHVFCQVSARTIIGLSYEK